MHAHSRRYHSILNVPRMTRMIWPFKKKTDKAQGVLVIAKKLASLEAERENAPAKPRFFGRDKESCERDLAECQQELIDLLEAGPLIQARDAVHRAERELSNARDAEANARERAGTQDDTPREVVRAREVVARAENALSNANIRLSDALGDAKISLTQGQLEALTVLPGGDDDIEMISFITNLRDVLKHLEKLIKNSKDSSTSARYYNYIVALLDATRIVQERVATRMRDVHLRRIGDRDAEVRKLINKTRELLRNETNLNRRKVLEANETALSNAISAVDLAKDRLRSKLIKLKEAIQRTQSDLKVAVNTAETVFVTQDLAKLLRETDVLFDEITALSIPEIIPFAGDEIRAELMRLSGRVLPTPMRSEEGVSLDRSARDTQRVPVTNPRS